MPETYYLSPYCVFHPQPAAAQVAAVHSLYGSRFEISSELFSRLMPFLSGACLENASRRLPAGERRAIEELIEEKILIRRDELETLGGEAVFRNRLQPVELAFLRGFNEGGLSSGAVDGGLAPAVEKPIHGLATIDLESRRSSNEAGVAAHLRRRRSIRSYSDLALRRNLLEEFLEIAARAYGLFSTPEFGAASIRNYPSGGARYPLEIYPIVYNVEELESAIYHYEPFRHSLTLLSRDSSYRRLLLGAVLQKLGRPEDRSGEPAVVFVITAVFERTCWKYRSVALHLILQEVGALYQTMYLAATELALAPCAIGAFPELAVDEMLGLDNREEAQVGMFTLGVPASEGAPISFVIESFQLSPDSPFSTHPAAGSIHLLFKGGMTETIALEEFEIETSAGEPVCYVMRRRFRARFDVAAWDRFCSLVRTGDNRLPDKFSHLGR